MIRGVRVQANNTTLVNDQTAGTDTATHLYTVPTGRTFVMTDLVVSWGSNDTATNTTTKPAISLFDIETTANSTFAHATAKFTAMAPVAVDASAAGSFAVQPLILNGFVNGPEFSTGITVHNYATATCNIPTGGIYIAGYLR